MSDRLFENAVRDWLADGSDLTPRAAIDAVLLAVRTTPQERSLRIPRRSTSMPTYLRFGAAVIAVLALVGGGAIWYVGQSTVPSPPTSPEASASPSTTPSPTARATAPRRTTDVVKGWPDNTPHNVPGLYSWDGVHCAGRNCLIGVLHSHNDGSSGQVRITIEHVAEPSISESDPGAAPATVAGHQGLYVVHPGDPRLEEWNVDFEGTLVSFSISIEGDASQTDIDEAHSMIASLFYEPRDNDLGFRLVFWLPNSHWDSPF